MYRGLRDAVSCPVRCGVDVPDAGMELDRAGSDELARVFEVAGIELCLAVGVAGSSAVFDDGEK